MSTRVEKLVIDNRTYSASIKRLTVRDDLALRTALMQIDLEMSVLDEQELAQKFNEYNYRKMYTVVHACVRSVSYIESEDETPTAVRLDNFEDYLELDSELGVYLYSMAIHHNPTLLGTIPKEDLKKWVLSMVSSLTPSNTEND
ncbi:MAG: hypothetical protein D6712_20895 [Chloroflexi bacterium]|nr:MAG: hypothetical protein D6712_20895 [Chloroflexota bacterium]